MKYTVYQFQSTPYDNEQIRLKEADVKVLNKIDKETFQLFFKPVCYVEADDLNLVFEYGNIGPEHKITRLRAMHSISVGDIIEDEEGLKHLVMDIGFRELDF